MQASIKQETTSTAEGLSLDRCTEMNSLKSQPDFWCVCRWVGVSGVMHIAIVWWPDRRGNLRQGFIFMIMPSVHMMLSLCVLLLLSLCVLLLLLLLLLLLCCCCVCIRVCGLLPQPVWRHPCEPLVC